VREVLTIVNIGLGWLSAMLRLWVTLKIFEETAADWQGQPTNSTQIHRARPTVSQCSGSMVSAEKRSQSESYSQLAVTSNSNN